jgi:hypothetical protein
MEQRGTMVVSLADLDDLRELVARPGAVLDLRAAVPAAD